MSALFETRGFCAGSVRVPPFELGQGRWLVLRWPANHGSDSENRFYDIISGSAACPDVELHARTKVVALFGKWAECLYRNRTVGQLLAALPAEDQRWLRVDIEIRRLAAELPFDHLPATSRLLAGLMLASLSGEVIVFNITGLDPTGIQKVYAYLADKIQMGLSVIELEFPSNEQREARPVAVTVLEGSQ